MTDFSAIHSQPGLVKTVFISKLKLGGLVESSRLFKQNQLPDAFHFIRLLGTIHHSLGTNKYTTHINWSSGKHKGLDRVFPLTNFPQPLPDVFSFTCSFPLFFWYYYQCQQLNQKESSKKPEEGFWHILFKLTWASLGTKDFVFNKLHGGHGPAVLCWSWTANRKGKKAPIVFICSYFTERTWKMWISEPVSADRRRTLYGFTVALLLWDGRAEGPEVISSRNSVFALAKHLLSSCGPPASKYNQSFSKKCDEIWMERMRIVLYI